VLGKPEPACLLIADTSGYTSFLAGAELDHARDVLADLVGTVVGSLRPALTWQYARRRLPLSTRSRSFRQAQAGTCASRSAGRRDRVDPPGLRSSLG